MEYISAIKRDSLYMRSIVNLLRLVPNLLDPNNWNSPLYSNLLHYYVQNNVMHCVKYDVLHYVRLDILEVKRHIEKIHTCILKAVFKNAGCVYGGYVRDWYAGTIPFDVDCIVGKPSNIDSIIHDIIMDTDGKYVVESVNENVTDYGTSTMRFLVYDVAWKVIRIQVDIHTSTAFDDVEFDFDVNLLEMSSFDVYGLNQSLWSRGEFEVSLDSVVRGINNAEFRQVFKGTFCKTTYEHQCMDINNPKTKKILDRIAKMEKRGWKFMDAEYCKNPECAIKHRKTMA